MNFSHHFRRFGLLLFILTTFCLCMSAKTIYYDNTATAWATPYIHYWGGSSESKFPGVAMTNTNNHNIWKYDVPDNTTGVLFNAGDGNNTKSGDFTATGDHVYTKANGDSGKNLTDYIAYIEAQNATLQPFDVYYDNSDTQWATVYIYYWGGEEKSSSWPGSAMTDTYTERGLQDIYKFTVPKGTKNIIFAGSSVGPQTKDLDAEKDKVYKMLSTDASKQGGEDKGLISSYTQNLPNYELADYTIYFHNTKGWSNVQVKINGNLSSQSSGGAMTSFLNSTKNEFSFQAPADREMTCSFYTNDNSSDTGTYGPFTLVNGHVYRVTGDKGDAGSYDFSQNYREVQWWSEPETPTQLQPVTIYFDRKYDPNCSLKDEDNLYIWIGYNVTGQSGDDWSSGPDPVQDGIKWDNITNYGTKFKFSKVEGETDLYSFTLSPSIADYFKLDADSRIREVMFIIRNSDGNTNLGSMKIPLRVIADPTAGLGAVSDFTNENGVVTINSEKGKLFLTPISPEIVKVFSLRNGISVTEERESISVLDKNDSRYEFTDPAYDVTSTDENIKIEMKDGISLLIDKSTSTITFLNAEGKVALRELSGLVNKNGNKEVSFEGMDDDGFYGGGYVGKWLNWEGKTMKMLNTQTGNWTKQWDPPHNICIPFYVSTSGYGVYFDDHYYDAKINPSKTGTSFASASQNPIAYYFIGGGDMEKVVANYTRLTGLSGMPPYWALGYLTSKFSFASRSEAEQTISKTKAVNIPVDGIVFDIHWQGGPNKMGKLDWDTGLYNNPLEMLEKFHDQNVHSIAITEPFFSDNCGNYNEMKNAGYFADESTSGMSWVSNTTGLIDITKESAKTWFKSFYKARTREGMDSWWLDLGEPEKHDSESTYEKGSMKQVHNEYGNRWIETAWEAMQELDQEAGSTPTRRVLLPRAGTSGMQRYTVFPWTGDISRSWDGLAAQVPALVNASMSGVSYLGSDIGGFIANGTDANLYRRWVQLGVFYPAMRTHSATCPEVWQDCYSSVRDDVRDAINLRYSYLPYLYTQSYRYYRYGTPIARPANYNDADKSVLNNCVGAYFWGPDIFVAPVLENSTTKQITFPDGYWLDMNNFSTVYSGHSSISYNAPANALPHFMRRGSFVPRYAQSTFTSTAEICRSSLIVDYYPSFGSTPDEGMIYDDNWTDVDPAKTGNYMITHLTGEGLGGSNGQLAIVISREGDGWSKEAGFDNQDLLIRIHKHGLATTHEVSLHDLGPSSATEAPRNAPLRAGTETVMPTKYDSYSDVDNDDINPSYAHKGESMYIRIPAMTTNRNYAIGIAGQGIFTEMPVASLAESMTLGCGNGMISYSAPEGTENLHIEIYNTTGLQVDEIGNLLADGCVHQVPVSLPAGLYIARLCGTNASGRAEYITAKIRM